MTIIRAGMATLINVLQNSFGLIRIASMAAVLAFSGEFLQHIWEVSAGMFASKAAFLALQASSDRMIFGIMKVAALFIAVFWSARLLAVAETASLGTRLGPIHWGPLLCSLVIGTIPLALVFLAPLPSREVKLVALIFAAIITIPFSRMGMDALFSQPPQSLRNLMRRRMLPPWTEFVGMMPIPALMYLHFVNHDLALGAPVSTLWLLMLWDSLLVMWLAIIMGVLTYRFYSPQRHA
jgi:hypothetical protein